MEKKDIKICFAASSGGHFEQILMLRPLMEEYDSFIITEKPNYQTDINDKKTYFLKQINRKEFFFPLKMIQNALISLYVFLREKPDFIITTGVLATIPICLISKIFGRKLIYIESFAKINSPSETGKLLYRYADQFYIQWETMKKFYPNAIYVGGIY